MQHEDEGYDIGFDSSSGSGSVAHHQSQAFLGSHPSSAFKMDNAWVDDDNDLSADPAAADALGQDTFTGRDGFTVQHDSPGLSTGQDNLQTVLEKEKVIKDIMTTQEGLRALLDRVNEVTDDIKKLSEENATLQIYLDNMTRNTAMLAAAGKGDKR